jgi:hypothetical protein
MFVRRRRDVCESLQLTAHKDKNATSLRSCQAKISVSPASHQHCTTKRILCTSCCQTDALDAGEDVVCGSGVSGCLAGLERGARMRKTDVRPGVRDSIVAGMALLGSRHPL